MPFAEINAFQPATVIHSRGVTRLHVTRLDESAPLVSSRRLLFRKLLQGTVALPATAALILGNPGISHAAVASPAELKKLQLGHARVQVGPRFPPWLNAKKHSVRSYNILFLRQQYLLKNWDALTETCNNKAMSSTEQKQVVRTEGGGGGFCDKTPLVVQEYLGYKSTEDPLFKADKLMLKAVPLVDESVLDAADYVDLVERYREKADQTSLMAYTSR